MHTKILKRTIILISLLIMTSIGLAQRNQGSPPQPSEQQIKQMIEELSSELDLSATQRSQVSKLFTKHFEEMKSKQTKKSGGKRPGRAAMESSRQRFEGQIRQVLSPDQIEAYDKFLQSYGPQSQRPKR
ncbi:MAG: hypothetical protein ISR87_00865 [Candidatus Marinimicrobia bacterium]|nr:hypothetical protein [FCB group bacterium]MBL7023976.1 hypothetical protein [Candidatus Neomarinimicrobiota bacterium]